MIAIWQRETANGPFVELKKGATDVPLFLFSGGDGNPNALAPLASRMHSSRALIAVDFCRPDDHGRLPSTVEIMADRSHSMICALQSRGPYYLVGYSFGGLVAMEVARLLRAKGEEVALLGLIDTRFDQRFWPTPILLRSQARLIRRHLAALLSLPLKQMAPMLLYRSRRLFLRLIRRRMPSSPVHSMSIMTPESTLEQHCKTLMANYRPRYYAGRITSFEAEEHDEYGCDPTQLWRTMATEIECRTIPGTHVGIVSHGASLTQLANALDSRLDTA
ncbi:thioesterase domain-containing protein [Bradyrhizobium sp. CCBAU 45384]|uniref:thioesterase domain-containing protein n=1 Tax=Bradyrhizobium sp. CCBAU 45384 TaxID=858428 RepID=UPI002305DF25|nr:alpha/beta fold hydrolase [Bradyrhizobium sp. CCBAU 45384]MDA9409904.1 hypothetical protein [Bradyrhizobium sp. CCBAU 45384]